MITPWYKQFWPWVLLTIPVITFIVGGMLLHFAMNTNDSLVIDDYYKEGRTINKSLDRIEGAQKRNITTDLNINDRFIAIKFHSGIPPNGEALKLSFYHVTLQSKDTEILLTRDGEGVYRGQIEQPLKGKWRVTLSPLNNEWKIENTLILPISTKVMFNP